MVKWLVLTDFIHISNHGSPYMLFSNPPGDRDILEQQVSPRVYDEEPQPGPSGLHRSAMEEEPYDFSASGSDDWSPSGAEHSDSSDDDDDEEVLPTTVEVERLEVEIQQQRDLSV